MDEMIKSQIAIRCAKASILLQVLKSSSNPVIYKTSGIKQQEEEMMRVRREIRELKMELAKERVRSKRIQLCGLMEFVLQLLLLFLLSAFFLLILYMSS